MEPVRAHVDGLATVHGAIGRDQAAMAADLRAALAPLDDARGVARMVGFVHEHAAIRTRYVEIPDEELRGRPDWVRLVNEANVRMATRALAALPEETRRAEAFVVVCSSYTGFPSLSRRLLDAAGLPLDALCFDLAGLGCAGPTHGLWLAHSLLARGRASRVCLLFVDAMGTHARCRRHLRAPDMAQVVGHALASDGAAALTLSTERAPTTWLSFDGVSLDSRLWPGSLDQNDLTADADNEPFLSVGKDIRTRIVPELEGFLDDAALAEPLLLHPGGAALMRILAERFPGLAPTVDLSMSVLSEHGNLGAASLIFVLRAALERGVRLGPRARLVALGPGIVSTCLRLDGVRQGGVV